jgi:NAD(P)-dependent dehydrogenase (short-subunit alcohol dehydrogenase family)
MTAEELNRQELNRLAYVQQPAQAAPPNGFDVLYSKAGMAKLGSVADTTEEVFDEIFDASFRAAYFTVQKALPLLTDGGAIVFTTSWFDEAGVAETSRCSPRPFGIHRGGDRAAGIERLRWRGHCRSRDQVEPLE